MNNRHSPSTLLRQCSLAAAVLLLPTAPAAIQTQTVGLDYGWNSVWLEVEPVDDEGETLTVDQVFTAVGYDIDIVARPLTPVGTAEFIDSPENTFNQAGWLVWYESDLSGDNDSILTHGNQAYLVHVALPSKTDKDGDPAGTLAISGRVGFFQPTWTRGAYNLVGFGISGRPRFAEFFAPLGLDDIVASPSDGSAPVIQRLDPATGAWAGVGGTDVLLPGEAYWIWVPFNLKNRHFAGPVAIASPGLSGLAFGVGPGAIEVADPQGNPGDTLMLTSRELTFSSEETDPAATHTITIAKVLPETSGTAAVADELRLYALEPKPESLAWQIAESGQVTSWNVVDLAGGATRTATVGAHRHWTTGEPLRENLYRIDVALDGGSVRFWLPAAAGNPDLLGGELGAPASQFTGLWVGEIRANEVTSATEDGRPLRPTTSPAGLPILIHVDTAGVPWLLSHVMFMQTKTAADSIAAEPVLVVDEAKIPYFEGIQERGGKKVGQRVETAFFDLPREMDATTQSALVAAAGLDGSEEATTDYVNAQTSRPAALVETYHLKWELAGGLGPDAIVRTADLAAGDAVDQPLRLDPFHRSNPFRHAYHPQHGAGYAIERSFTITFDPDYEPGLLRGTYQETTTGLADFDLVSRGRITLQRVSLVGELQ